MDISTITDKDKLQSLAYEQVKLLNQAQSNLNLIEQRLVQLEQNQDKQPGAVGIVRQTEHDVVDNGTKPGITNDTDKNT